MNPAVAALDRALARAGETIMLRRQVSTNPLTFVDVQVRARVRGYGATELIGGITQTDSFVIISPTEIAAAAWPGPPKKGDKAVIQGRSRNVEMVNPIYAGGELVRIEMRVLG